MIYILKTEINENSNIMSGLCKVYGIGSTKAQTVINTLGLTKTAKFKDLSQRLRGRITQLVEDQFLINDDLRKELLNSKQTLVTLRTYRESAIIKTPRRGQPSYNAKTIKN